MGPRSNLSDESRSVRPGGRAVGAKRYAENASPNAIPEENANLRPLAHDVHEDASLRLLFFDMA